MTITDIIIRRTLTVYAVSVEDGKATLEGARLPLRELSDMHGRDVLVLTLAELQAVALEARADGARQQLALEASAHAGLD